MTRLPASRPAVGPLRRAGVRPQIIIAIVIAAIGLIGYLMKSQTNPVTGEKQYVSLTPQQEVALGVRAAPQMAAQMGGVVPPNDPMAKLVKTVGRRLVDYTEAAKGPYQYDFHLLADPRTINAFALPGGQIFITRGLLDRLQTEAQLAGVLGHEIGHVVNRHSAEHMAKSQLGQSLATAAGAAASDDQGRGYQAAAVAQMVNQMVQLKYGRDDERESDDYGMKYMVQAGYNPEGMLGVMKVLGEASKGNRQPEFLASHPYPQERWQRAQEFLKKNFPNGIPPNLTEGVPLDTYRRGSSR